MAKVHPSLLVLKSFPPEIWSSVAFYLPGEELGILKATGAKWLWLKLRTPHAVKSVILGKGGLMLKSWPAYLNELPCLEELAIDGNDDAWCWNWSPKLHMVPKTLRKLKIDWTEEKTSSFMAKAESLELATHLPLLETLDVNLSYSVHCSWLIPSPPNLTSLKMAKWYSEPLPPTLIHLYLEAIYADLSLYPIPPCLETISFPDFSEEKDLAIPLNLLPATLRSLKIHRQNRSLYPNQVALLPKGLTELSLYLGSNIYTFPELQTAPQEFLDFPKGLTCLVILELPSQCWPYLPQTLKRLSIKQTTKADATLLRSVIDPFEDEVHEFYTLPIHTLPRSITDLYIHIHDITYIDFGLVSSSDSEESSESLIEDPYPPYLTSLWLEEAQLSVQSAKALPASLSCLKVLNMDDSVCKHIPHRLHELWIDNAIMTENFVKFLPRTLTALYITNHDLQSSWIDPKSCEVTVPAEAIPGYTTEREATDALIPLLPDQLLTLQLHNAKKVTGKSFKHLPKHLTYLDLLDSAEIFDSDIIDLPQCLRTLILHSAVYLTNECVEHLPTSLENLGLIKNSRISKRNLGGYRSVF